MIDLDAPILPWDPALETGIPSIDREHQKLLGLINQAAHAERSGQTWQLEAVLDGLVDYSLVHFRHEERLMEAGQFPGLEAHRLEHQNFHTVITGLYTACLQGKRPEGNDLSGLLRDWLRNHILGTDMQYVESLKALEG